MTFLSYEIGKGQNMFYPIKLSHFAEKKIKFVGYTKISYGGLIDRVKRLIDEQKIQQIFWRVLGIQTS